jgi:hypothetical protein
LWGQETGGEDESSHFRFVKVAILFSGQGFVFFFCGMSGVKQDFELGRKFESGASKRKRKA